MLLAGRGSEQREQGSVIRTLLRNRLLGAAAAGEARILVAQSGWLGGPRGLCPRRRHVHAGVL